MSMKQEIETWVAALAHYDNQRFEDSLVAFDSIADTSKILFNCGVIHATLGEHEKAVEYYQKAVRLDQYLAVAYFQQGVSNFLLGDFEEALANFNDALLYLRGNSTIDYEQLGLKFKLYSCEVLFNRGLCYIYLQQTEAGMQDLVFAVKEKAVADHDVIDEAIKDRAEGYTVFSIPVGVVFRPSEAKVKNVRTRDYLGKAKLVRQQSPAPSAHHRRQMSAEHWAKDDRPPEKLSYAAQHLVRPNLQSRSRQQSEPPIRRDLFPPTPPPETEKPILPKQSTRREHSPNSAPYARSQSVERAHAPPRLNLGAAAFTQPSREQARPQRSVSERPPVDRNPERRRDQSDSYSVHSSREPLFGAIDDDEPVDLSNLHIRQSTSSKQAPRFSRQSQNTIPSSIREEELEEVTSDTGSVMWSPVSVTSTSRYLSGGVRSSKPPSVQRIRAKVHFEEDTRYVIVPTTVRFADFYEQILRKFSIKSDFRLKTKDEEGDMITMADQDDLDMAVMTCKDAARKDGSDIGKMEVWVQALDAAPAAVMVGQAR